MSRDPTPEEKEMLKTIQQIKDLANELVFKGYTTEEIAFMGTCLIRFALEQAGTQAAASQEGRA